MKKLLLVFVLSIFAGLSLTSCDKDEAGNSLLVGEWILTHGKGLVGGQDYPGNELSWGLGCVTLKFAENGEWHEKPCDTGFFGTDIAGTYTTSGIFLTLKGSSKSMEYSYSVTSNTLKLTYTPEDQDGTHDGVYTIVTTFTRK